jgi:enterochelin esterase-like enzyme
MVLVSERTEIARTLAIWIDIGADDEWAPLAIEFENELNELRITNQWHLWPGGHTDVYWSSHVADYLRFYDAALAGKVFHS